MSVLATRLGVTLSTVSGLVERLVEAGCVARHDDPVDRRQVVVTLTPEGDALIERFRDLNRSQMRSLLVLLSDDDLGAVERAVIALTRVAAVAREPARRTPYLLHRQPDHRSSRHVRKGILVSRITEFAVRRRSVTLLLAVAVFISGVYAWGSLQQELLPDIEFPIITVIAPYPGTGAADVTEQVTKPIERAISRVQRLTNLQSTSANSISLVVAQFSYGTDVRETRAAIEQNLATVGLPQGVTPQVSALNINQQPVIIASISGTGDAGLDEAARLARTDIVPALQGIDGVGAVDVTGGLEQRLMIISTRPSRRERGVGPAINGVLAANNLTLPAGRSARTGRTSRCPLRTSSRRSTDRRPGRRGADAEPAHPGRPGQPESARARRRPPARCRPRRPRSRSVSSGPSSGRRRHHRLCPDRWPAGCDCHGLQDVRGEHRHGGRRGPGRTDRGPGTQPRHPHPDGLGPVRLHQGVAATASSARAVSARCSRS
jgi:hypothetical protein